MSQRILGYDVARALAIFGMVFVNFKIALNATQGNAWLLQSVSLLEGRASALFVVLAGVGIALMTAKARVTHNNSALQQKRLSIIKRGLLLIIVGLSYVPIWEADILHFYGFYFLLTAWLFNASERVLWISIFVLILAFPILNLLFEYDTHWDWKTLTYHNFWTVDGMVRHIFFNGFHPVIPWAAFLVLGLWLGRLNLMEKALRYRIMGVAAATYILTETVSYFATQQLTHIPEVALLFDTQAIPPYPLYLIAAGSLAVLVITLCITLSEYFANSWLIKALYQTGQFALTLYIAHVFIGMGFMEAMGLFNSPQSIEIAVIYSLGFCVFSIVFALVWSKFLGMGPLERVFRFLAR